MRDINQYSIAGNVGQDPKTGKTQNGKDWVSFSVATQEKVMGKENEFETTWHNVVAFGSIAGVVKHVKKGNRIFCTGKYKLNKYKDKDGVEKQSAQMFLTGALIGARFDKEQEASEDFPPNF